jgi:hypothetical protein
MTRTRHVRRLAAALAGLISALLGLAAAAPAALADPRPPHPPPGWYKHPPLPAHTHTMAAGGMPGWQITLIAAAAVLVAALAVTVYRIRAAHRATPSTA